MNNKKYKTGVVVGKFYPPHKGHHYLINTALKNTESLTVLVCAEKDQFISGELRARWIKEIHPDANVLLIDDDIREDKFPDDYSKAWADYTIKLLGYTPDVAFTSEEYGERWAKYMGCKHVLVDLKREAIPCSGTMIRANPLKYLDFLEAPVRAHFVKRICIVGAESTGKTTMAKALAQHYQTNWVPEYGREYSEAKMYRQDANKWQTDEFMEIAREQCRREDLFARTAHKVLICDTDAFATGIWHERYVRFRSKEVEAISKDRKYNLYLLTDIDIPFIQDGTRDGEHIREWMHNTFITRLTKENKKFEILSGNHEKRLAKAINLIDSITQN